MSGKAISFVFIITLFIVSCAKKPVEKQFPVAKVYDKYLYLSDIKHIFPEKVTQQDSINIATAYINTWVKTQLILRQATNNLTPEQKDITQQLESYGASLLIFKYEDQMVKQKVDTVVTEKQIEEYYNQNSSNFILEENLVKALYLKIPISAPDIEGLKKWYKSDKTEDLNKLDSYCYNYAAKYDFFKDSWISFTQLQHDLPQKIDNHDEFLKNNSYVEQQDTSFYYFVNIKDKSFKGSLAPLVYVKTKIFDIIMNKRKISYLNDLETNIFNEAQDHKNFEIYNLDKQ